MFETQHLSGEIADWWVLGSRWDSLGEAVEALGRRLARWNGEGRTRNTDEYRIVERNKKGRIVRTFDFSGRLMVDASPAPKPTARRRVPVAA